MIHSFQEVSTFLNNKLSFVISISIYISNDLKEKYSLGYKINSYLPNTPNTFFYSFNALAPKISKEETIETTIEGCRNNH